MGRVHLAGQPKFGGHGLRAAAQLCRGQHIARLVYQCACIVLRLADKHAFVKTGLRRPLVHALGDQQGQRRQRHILAVGFVRVGVEVREDRAFDDGPGGFGIRCFGKRLRQGDRHLAQVARLGIAHSGPGGFAQSRGSRTLAARTSGLSQADQQQALCREGRCFVDQQGFVRARFELAAGEHIAY